MYLVWTIHPKKTCSQEIDETVHCSFDTENDDSRKKTIKRNQPSFPNFLDFLRDNCICIKLEVSVLFLLLFSRNMKTKNTIDLSDSFS